MKKRKTCKTLAILCGVFVLTAMFSPLAAFAQTLSSSDTVQPLETQTKEMTVLREEFVKHFELPDGTGAAVVYDSPVHYEKDGTWVEIDNTLVSATKIGNEVTAAIFRNDKMTAAADADTKGAAITAYYENNDNPFKVQLPAAMNKNAPIAVTHGDYTLRFCFDGAEGTSSGKLEQPLTTREKNAQLRKALSAATDEQAKVTADKEHAMTVWKNRSAITFASVQPNVDLQYHVSGAKLKETLLFQKVPTAHAFSFTFTYAGLQAVLQKDNSVHFVDDAGEVAFIVAAPYMFDNAEGYSTDIMVTLQETATGCRYTLTPDRAWLTDAKRVYPVTLDPTVKIPQNSSYMVDAGVQQSNPNTAYNNYDRIYVGSGPNSTRGVMYFNILQWPSFEWIDQLHITGAELSLNYYPNASWQTGNNFKIEAYRLINAWPTTNTTWNNTTDVYGIQVSFLQIGDARQKISGIDKYNVTNWVKYRYGPTNTDFGLRLQPEEVSSSINRVCYISADYTADAAQRPLLEIYYNFKYTLNLQQYYDEAFAARYTNPSVARSKMRDYTEAIQNYFLVRYGIKINSTISPYTSVADQCTHKSNINSLCGNALSSTCKYSTGVYHCTNIENMLYTNPVGVENAHSTKVIKWTGHPTCDGCSGNAQEDGGGITDVSIGTLLICLGDISGRTEEENDQVFTAIFAHEFAHLFGCIGDNAQGSNACTDAKCITDYHAKDAVKYQNIKASYGDGNFEDAYCSRCDNFILAYAEQYLRG